MNSKSIAVAAVLVIAIGVAGYLFGQQKSGQQVQNLKLLVDLAYPPPPQEIYSLSGVVKGIYGATINLEVSDPEDYLPHPDGSSPKKEMRFANVTAATTYTLVDYTRFDNNGNPIQSKLDFSSLKAGDTIFIRTSENIKNAQKFDVASIGVVKY